MGGRQGDRRMGAGLKYKVKFLRGKKKGRPSFLPFSQEGENKDYMKEQPGT